MNKLILLALILTLAGNSLQAQKYFTRNAEIEFFSETPMENIEAQTTTGTVVLDAPSEKIESAVLIKSFQFEQALMQEHFNEDYMESAKYPKSTFKGIVEGLSEFDILNVRGNYDLRIIGDLTIHGVKHFVSEPATIDVEEYKITIKTKFTVALEDYGIKVPSLVRENIAETVDVNIKAELYILEQ